MADQEPPVRELTPLGAVALAFIALAALFGVVMLGSAFTDGDTVSIVFIAAANVVAPMVALYVGLTRYAPKESTGAAIGLVMPDGRDWALMAIAVVVGAALMPIAIEVFVRMRELFPSPPPEEPEPVGGTAAIVVFATVVAIPVVNELLFRGFIQGRLQKTRGATQAWVMTLLLMSLLEVDMTVMPMTMVLMGPLGYLALRARSVSVVIAGHVAQQALPFIAAALGWAAFEGEGAHIPVPVLLGCAAICAMGMVIAAQPRFARRG